jgi:hypothetical protein
MGLIQCAALHPPHSHAFQSITFSLGQVLLSVLSCDHATTTVHVAYLSFLLSAQFDFTLSIPSLYSLSLTSIRDLLFASPRHTMGVLEFLSDRRFHRSYVLPPNLETGRELAHRFSYADFGDPSSNAVVFFCGALMGTRFCYSPMDQLANAYNVRILHVDRPGIGGSDPIELEKRIQIWLGQILSITRIT